MEKLKSIFGKVKAFCKGVLARTNNSRGNSPVYSFNLARAMPIETENNSNTLIKKSLNFSRFINISGLFLILLSIFSLSVSSADPGHGASAIDSGTFASGDFIFPLNLFINQNLTVFGRNFTIGSTLFIDSILNRVGIGTTTPSNTLDVRGIGNFSGNLYVGNGTLVNIWLYNASRAFNQSIELGNAYAVFWINQTGSLMPFVYNQSSASETQFGKFWSNQTSPYQSLFYNYSLADLWNITFSKIYPKALNYTVIIGTGLFNSSDDLNLIIGIQPFRITTINASGEIYVKNGTALSIWAYNQTWSNESSSYAPIKFGYNMSNYSSQELQPSYSKFWVNQTGSLMPFVYNMTTPLLSMSNIWTAVQTFNQNLTVLGNLSVDGSTFYVDNNNDRVGIGTTSPASKFVVEGTRGTSSQGQILVNGTTDHSYIQVFTANPASSEAGIQFIGTGGTIASPNWGIKIPAGTADLQFVQVTPSVTAMTIKNNTGNVGIGTTNPRSQLDVVSNITTSGNITIPIPNSGVTFNNASRIYDNGTCLILAGRVSKIEVC